MAQSKVTGEYALTGIHDMASGFKFNADKTFEFFYIYGAVDRFAKGTYEIVGDTIKLKSQKTAGLDFEIKSEKKKGNGFHLSFTDPNRYLIKNIKCFFYQGSNAIELETDNEGKINYSENKIDKIYAQHLMFIDVPSLIKDSQNENNYFELALKPSLAEVSFKGINLLISRDHLAMLPNYFMPFENIVYQKQE